MPRKKSLLLANHQKSWLWGSIAVHETLTVTSFPVQELLIASTVVDQAIVQQCQQWAEHRNIPIHVVSPHRIEQLCQAKDHQGLLARLGPFPYADFSNRLNQCSPNSRWLIVDRIQDSYNLGAILRSSAAFGFDTVLMGHTQQVGINVQVIRSSVGTVHRLAVCRVENFLSAIQQLKQAGMKIIAADMHGTLAPDEVQSRFATDTAGIGLILGNEANGVSADCLQLCDATVAIPMHPQVESLNAAVAAGILMYALRGS